MAGELGDPLEVGVVVEDFQVGLLGTGGDAGRVPEGPAAQPILTAMAVGVALSGERAAESAALAERALREGGFAKGGLTAESLFIAAWTLIFSDRPELAESAAREMLGRAGAKVTVGRSSLSS